MKNFGGLFQWFFSDAVEKSVSTTTIRRIVCGIWGTFLILSLAMIPLAPLAQGSDLFDSSALLHFFNRIFFGIYFPVFLSFGIFWLQWKGKKGPPIRLYNEIAYAIVGATLLCNIIIFSILLGTLFGRYEFGNNPPLPEMRPELVFDSWILNIIQIMVLISTLPLARLLGVEPMPIISIGTPKGLQDKE